MKSKSSELNKEKIFDKIITSYVIINLLYVFICSYLSTVGIVYYRNYGKSMIGALILNTIFIVIMVIIKKFKFKNYKFKIYDLLIILLSIFAIISCKFAISRYAALYGFYLRYEGVFAILYYYSVFYITSFVKKEHKKILAVLIVILGVIDSIYAYLQMSGSSLVKKIYDGNSILVVGFNNNPNFFATNMLLSLSVCIGLFIDTSDKLYKVIYGMFIIILMYGLTVSNTRSCIVGLFVVFLYILVFVIKNKKWADLGIIILLISLVFMYMHFNGMTTLVHFLNGTKNETIKLISGDSNSSFGAKRLGVWKYSMMIAPHYFLHGAGIDNFAFAFGGRAIRIGPYMFDKAHNEYIQLLITQGIFAFISYLVLIGIVLFNGIKNSFKEKELYLVLPVIGYLVQAFFNISVIDVAPVFFLSLGLLVLRKNKNFIS